MTKVVDSLMELKSSPETDDYRYFDPKLLRATDRWVACNKLFTCGIVLILCAYLIIYFSQ